jgi:hypothetical protein
MDQGTRSATVEDVRQCPKCAYVMEPFDTECPRCDLGVAPQTAVPPTAAPAGPAPAPVEWENTSGTPGAAAPPEILGWNWGAFLLTPFWAIAHQVWIGLLCFVPYVGWIMSIVLGIKGSEWAWQNRRFSSAQEFRDVQRAWMLWGVGITLLGVVVGFLFGLMIPILAAVGGSAGQ